MSQEIDTDWETLFLWNETPYFGYCSSVDEAEDLVEEYSYRTSTSFVVTRCSKDFGFFSLTGLSVFSTVGLQCNLDDLVFLYSCILLRPNTVFVETALKQTFVQNTFFKYSLSNAI